MNWQNGRKMEDDWESIRYWYFDQDMSVPDLTQEELLELHIIRARLARNQAR